MNIKHIIAMQAAFQEFENYNHNEIQVGELGTIGSFDALRKKE